MVLLFSALFALFAGLELMGFKPKNMIKPYFHVHSAQFIYPDESVRYSYYPLCVAYA
jgi:Ku70/Ku80 beta-barrel domain